MQSYQIKRQQKLDSVCPIAEGDYPINKILPDPIGSREEFDTFSNRYANIGTRNAYSKTGLLQIVLQQEFTRVLLLQTVLFLLLLVSNTRLYAYAYTNA